VGFRWTLPDPIRVQAPYKVLILKLLFVQESPASSRTIAFATGS
jgi:hypothetical protein